MGFLDILFGLLPSGRHHRMISLPLGFSNVKHRVVGKRGKTLLRFWNGNGVPQHFKYVIWHLHYGMVSCPCRGFQRETQNSSIIGVKYSTHPTELLKWISWTLSLLRLWHLNYRMIGCPPRGFERETAGAWYPVPQYSRTRAEIPGKYWVLVAPVTSIGEAVNTFMLVSTRVFRTMDTLLMHAPTGLSNRHNMPLESIYPVPCIRHKPKVVRNVQPCYGAVGTYRSWRVPKVI